MCHPLDADLVFLFAWLEGEGASEEGELFLANPIVKNFHIHRNLFLLDDHKVRWRKSGEEGTAFGGPLVSPQAGSPHAVPLRDGNGTLGVDRTEARLKDRFCWYGLLRDADKYLFTCRLCSRKMCPQRHARANMLSSMRGSH